MCRLRAAFWALSLGASGCSLVVPLDGYSGGEEEPDSMPFKGTPISLPGKVEAEDYDLGGQGIAYHDRDEENLGKSSYRPGDGVDVYADGAGQAIGWRQGDEWAYYTVEVKETAVYRITARLMAGATDSGATHVWFGGRDRSGPLRVAESDRGKGWVLVSKANVPLEAGRYRMRIVNGLTTSGGAGGWCGNLDWVTIER